MQFFVSMHIIIPRDHTTVSHVKDFESVEISIKLYDGRFRMLSEFSQIKYSFCISKLYSQ